jgi:hypothetical protein
MTVASTEALFIDKWHYRKRAIQSRNKAWEAGSNKQAINQTTGLDKWRSDKLVAVG